VLYSHAADIKELYRQKFYALKFDIIKGKKNYNKEMQWKFNKYTAIFDYDSIFKIRLFINI